MAGRWHHVLLELWVSSTSGNLLGQLALDGQIRDLVDSDSFIFDKWDWTAVTSWIVGGSYVGDMAELYVDLQGNVTASAITASNVAAYRDPATGKAPGLGFDGTADMPGSQSCTNPTGLTPQICLRGGPCDFLFGPQFGNAFVYIFRPQTASVRTIPFAGTLAAAASDPCLNINVDFPGKFCPEVQNPPN